MLGMLGLFIVVRFGDLAVRGALGYAFKANLWHWLLDRDALLPGTVRADRQRRRPPQSGEAFSWPGPAIMLGGIFMRLNAS